MSKRSLPCKQYDEIGLGLLLLAWRFFFFFCQRTTSARKLCAWKLRTAISKPSSRLWRGTKSVFSLPALGREFEDRPSTSLQTKHHDPEVDQSNWTSPGLTEFAHFKISSNIMLIVIFGHMAPSSCVRTKLTRPVHSAHENPNGEKKQIGLRRSRAPMSECMQMNRCQGRKASRSVPSNRLFPMVTVTNVSQNRSTLNSCNFAVPWRIELNFFALESWRVPLFNSIIFIGKSWGLKNHPWSLLKRENWRNYNLEWGVRQLSRLHVFDLCSLEVTLSCEQWTIIRFDHEVGKQLQFHAYIVKPNGPLLLRK